MFEKCPAAAALRKGGAEPGGKKKSAFDDGTRGMLWKFWVRMNGKLWNGSIRISEGWVTLGERTIRTQQNDHQNFSKTSGKKHTRWNNFRTEFSFDAQLLNHFIFQQLQSNYIKQNKPPQTRFLLVSLLIIGKYTELLNYIYIFYCTSLLYYTLCLFSVYDITTRSAMTDVSLPRYTEKY